MGLLEAIIGVAVFFIVALASYRAFVAVLGLFATTNFKTNAADVAEEKIELVRNVPYSNVGTIGGIPAGVLPPSETIVRSGDTFIASTTVRSIDDPFDGIVGGNPNDTAPADYKLVEISVTCISCADQKPANIAARVAPKGLETASTNGALFVQAIDANGQAVSGATVYLFNARTNPLIDLYDATDASGFLRLVDVPPQNQSYEITVSKTGYSTDGTLATSTGNPNPVKPHATVSLGQVTQATFVIDHSSALNFSSVDETCQIVPDVGFTITGSKLIGTNPDVVKTAGAYATNTNGIFALNNLEWDTYNFNFANQDYDIEGTIPDLPITIAPNATQNVKLITRSKQSNIIVVSVRDSVSGLPLSGADAGLARAGFWATSTTGRGFLRQTDWSGGLGQDIFTTANKYYADDSNVDVTSSAGDIKLRLIATSTYAPAGILTSSTFDTGSPSNFYTVSSNPTSQPAATGQNPVQMQIATATTTIPTQWNYVGPDGTNQSYYTPGNPNIPVNHNGDQYLRYRLYLQTASTTYTPTVSDVAVTFASDCVPSGQTYFGGLSLGSYTLTVSRTGYETQSVPISITDPWQYTTINLIPQ